MSEMTHKKLIIENNNEIASDEIIGFSLIFKRENHFGEEFTGVCPHCGSSKIQEFSTVNRILKFGCSECKWMWGVRRANQKLMVRGCFYLEREK